VSFTPLQLQVQAVLLQRRRWLVQALSLLLLLLPTLGLALQTVLGVVYKGGPPEAARQEEEGRI
jgi:hypothetical protein